jgi:hypothetical protein
MTRPDLRQIASMRALMLSAILLAGTGSNPLLAQTGEVSGRILDQRTQQPIVGASLRVEGTTVRAATDVNGAFRLTGLTAGTQTLQVSHIAYGEKTVEVVVQATRATIVRITLTETAIVLEPVTVNVLSADERRERGAGYRRNVVTREQIASAEHTNMDFAEVLRSNVSGVLVRRLDRFGMPICIELRARGGTGQGGCQSPAVFLDGAPIVNPTTLYGTLGVDMIETIEVVPASEAGVRFGSMARYGALLIQTRRPGAISDAARPEAAPRPVVAVNTFSWEQDPKGHRTALVFATSAAANAAGLGLGYVTARQCLHYRTSDRDGIVSECGALTTFGAVMSALVLPAVSTGLMSRLAGRTDYSEGKLGPALVGGAMTLLPGYGLMMTGERNNDEMMTTFGYVLLAVGPPIMTTAADYLFRQIRGQKSKN